MSRFTTSTNHPIIPNANEYMIEQRVVSIHSEDRDVTKYPNSSCFEIELPDDYVNVSTIRLGNYSFPSSYNVFSATQGNIYITFKINQPFNPSEKGFFDPLLDIIFQALYANIDTDYLVTITQGSYTATQMATELTNLFNEAVNSSIYNYISANNPSLLQQYLDSGGYNQFVIVYNEVSQKLWFGNKSSGFIITNDSKYYCKLREILNIHCIQCNQTYYQDFTNWGLPSYLGFTKAPSLSISNPVSGIYPRFYYGDALTSGDKGYWLIPDANYQTQTVYYLEAPNKIDLLGYLYFYMELQGLNNIDEIIPYNLNEYTKTTNEINGVHNSAFAKIGIISAPTSQFYDNSVDAIKIYNPPAEKIRKVKVKFRYHNGLLVDFGNFNYSFNLIFQILRPQSLRTYITFNPSSNFSSGSSNSNVKR